MTGGELEEWMAKVDAALEDLTRRVDGATRYGADHEREIRRLKNDLRSLKRQL